MRITSFTIFNQLTRSLNDNMRIMSRLGEKLSTGKKINSPSDDATGMMKAMDYKVSINEIENYKRNIDEADSHLSFIETTMSSVTNALTRARELAIQASTGTQTPESRNAIAQEVTNLRDQVMNLASSKFRNKFIFSGYKTDTVSFAGTTYNYLGDSGEMKVMIDGNADMAINIPGDQAFSVGGTSYMATLDNLYNDLVANNQTGIQSAVTNIDSALDQVANVRADIGARLSYLDDLQSNLDNRGFTLKTFLSETEDTDLAGTISELAKTELALQSLRQSGAKILSQSLMDFLG